MATLLEGIKGYKLGALRTRFWAYVHEDGRDHDLPADQCWEWRGSVANGGPVFHLGDGLKPARCVAFALEVEDYEDDLHVLTTCRNPLCVNPAHLMLVARRPENSASSELKAAAVAAVNRAVWSTEELPNLSTQVCDECGAPAEDYHHYLGYDSEHWLDVKPLCRKCHRRAEWLRIKEDGPVYHLS